MSRRSFEAINYSLRPNKNVERKLIATSLRHIGTRFPISDYRYIGFGSMWFTDFILFHKMLGISDMVTMEQSTDRRRRVEFNKPYSCIKVEMGEAASIVGGAAVGKKSLIWLDYDGGLKSALTGDVEIAVGAMESGSMIMVSVNGMRGQLDGHRDSDGEPIQPIDYLIEISERPDLRTQEKRLTRKDFPKLVSEVLHDRIKAAVLSTAGMTYVPIWNFWYADDADMVTVGGMVVNEMDDALLSECALSNLRFLTNPDPYEIKLPILTDKEKRELDRLLPTDTAISQSDLPFELRPTEIEAYRKFYLEYPLYGEIAA